MSRSPEKSERSIVNCLEASCFCNQRITYCQENCSLLNFMWCVKRGMYCQLDYKVKVYRREFVYLRRLHLFVFLSTSFGAWQLLDKWASWTKSRTITDQRCSSVYFLCGSNVLRKWAFPFRFQNNFRILWIIIGNVKKGTVVDMWK